MSFPFFSGQDEYNPMMHCYLVIELAVRLFIAVFLEVDTQACLAQLCRWACGDVLSKSPGDDENKVRNFNNNFIFLNLLSL